MCVCVWLGACVFIFVSRNALHTLAQAHHLSFLSLGERVLRTAPREVEGATTYGTLFLLSLTSALILLDVQSHVLVFLHYFVSIPLLRPMTGLATRSHH